METDFRNLTIDDFKLLIAALNFSQQEIIDIFFIKEPNKSENVKEVNPNMKYPKPYMSITELVGFTGLSRDYFKNIALAKEQLGPEKGK
jgi:hypothetical protein